MKEKEYKQSSDDSLKRESELKEKITLLSTKLDVITKTESMDAKKLELLKRLDQVESLKNALSQLKRNDKLKGEQLDILVTEKNRLELEFLTLQAQLKDTKNTSDNSSQLKFLKEIESLSNKLEQEKKLNAQLKAKTDDSSLQKMMQSKEKQIDNLSNKIAAQAQQIESLTQLVNESKEKITGLNKTNTEAQIAGSLASDTALLKAVKSESTARKQITILNEAYKRKLVAAQKKYDSLNKKLKQSKSMTKTYKANLTNLSNRFDKLVASIKSNTTAMALHTEQAKKTRDELKRLTSENNRLNALVTKFDIEKLIAENKSFKRSLEVIEIKNLDMKQKIDELERIKIDPDVDLFVRQIKRKNSAIDQLIEQIEELKIDNEGLTANFEKMDRKMSIRNEKLMQYKQWLDTKSKNFEALADLKNKLQEELKALKK